MFNIFKKLIKKEENENLQEQEQVVVDAQVEDNNESPEMVDLGEYLYNNISTPAESFDNTEENFEVSEQIEDIQPEVISVDEQEVEFPQGKAASLISELESLNIENEAAQETEEVFSLSDIAVDFSPVETESEVSQPESFDFTEESIEESVSEFPEDEIISLEQMQDALSELEIIQELPQEEPQILREEPEILESFEDEIISIEQMETELIQTETAPEIFQSEDINSVVEIKEEKTEIKEETSSKGFFGISFTGLKEAVSKTSEFFSSNIFSLGTGKEEIDDDLLDEMEEKFIRADIGIDTTVYIIERLREKKNKIKPDKLSEYLKGEFKEIIKAPGLNDLNLKQNQLNTILITGVNGAGKTTLIGKLAYRFKLQGKKVLVAAGDTFRAAAEDQLEIWADRAGASIVRQDGADPASVVFDSIKKAHAENYDILLIDTAGRLHNKFNLMEELKKIKKVIDKEASESLVESILVLDATTGQNGLKQAEVFKEAVNLTGVGLTKLDGTAKGGVILGIAKELNLPVKLIGVGEKMEDLKDFNADDFIEALF